jgi:hypothetical protein
MILLDDRRRIHAHRADGADSFEACVSSAASLIHLLTLQGFSVGLTFVSRRGRRGESSQTGTSPIIGGGAPAPLEFGKGPDHERQLMQRLAVVSVAASGDLASAIGELLDARMGSTYLAVVTTEIDPSWEGHAGGGRMEHGLPMLVVRHLRHTYLNLHEERAAEEDEKALASALAVERAGGTVVDVRAGALLKPAWELRLGGRVSSVAGTRASV